MTEPSPTPVEIDALVARLDDKKYEIRCDGALRVLIPVNPAGPDAIAAIRSLQGELAAMKKERDGAVKMLAAVRDDAMRLDNELCSMEFRAETAEALASQAESLSTDQPRSVRVKPLVWPDSIRRGQRVESSGGLLTYTIAHYGGSQPESGVVYRWAIERGGWSEAFFAYEHAIAEAQADYERRILATLHPRKD